MTIIDALLGNGDWAHVRVSCGDRWLVAHRDGEGLCLTVYEQQHRQKYARCLTETSNEDEAVRYLIGEK